MFQIKNNHLKEFGLSGMPCHITDEKIGEQEEEQTSRICSISELSLYDLMGQEYELWLTNNKEFGFDLEITSEDEGVKIRALGVHPFAIESFADFCKRFVNQYDNACHRLAQTVNQ